jgi:hypothetical protein
MRLLKIAAADFGRGDMGGNRQHRHVVTVTVKQTVDQMQVSRPAGAGADGQFTRELRFCACGKGGNLFMAGWHPFNGFHLVEAVASPFRESPVTPQIRFTPACSSVFAIYAATVCFMVSVSFL